MTRGIYFFLTLAWQGLRGFVVVLVLLGAPFALPALEAHCPSIACGWHHFCFATVHPFCQSHRAWERTNSALRWYFYSQLKISITSIENLCCANPASATFVWKIPEINGTQASWTTGNWEWLQKHSFPAAHTWHFVAFPSGLFMHPPSIFYEAWHSCKEVFSSVLG